MGIDSGPSSSRDPKYARYKVEMENALHGMPHVLIARTSLILSLGNEDAGIPPGKGVQFVVDALQGKAPNQNGPFVMFTDELRCMSFSDDLGAALVEIAGQEGNIFRHRVVHLVSDEVTNRYELACRLARHFDMSEAINRFVIAGLSAESGLNRPLNCALSNNLLKSLLKTTRIRGLSERLPSE